MAKILLVEDDAMLSELYTELLRGEGYTVETAKDGQEALLCMREGGYDLVLLDIMLPKITGLTVLQELAKLPPKNPNKKIVLMTNLGQEQTIEESKKYGIAKYLVKSNLTPDQFLSEVKSSLSSQ